MPEINILYLKSYITIHAIVFHFCVIMVNQNIHGHNVQSCTFSITLLGENYCVLVCNMLIELPNTKMTSVVVEKILRGRS